MEQLLEGLLNVVPTLPITEEKMEIFLTTLRSVIPDIEIALDHTDDIDEDNISKDTSSKSDDNSDNDSGAEGDDGTPVKASAKKLKLKAIRKKAQKLKAITVDKAQGNVSYKIISTSKKLKKKVKINSKGVITISKWPKAKKGTYKTTIKFKGNKYYRAVTKKVKIKMK